MVKWSGGEKAVKGSLWGSSAPHMEALLSDKCNSVTDLCMISGNKVFFVKLGLSNTSVNNVF